MTRPARPQLTLAAAATAFGVGLGIVLVGVAPAIGVLAGVLIAVVAGTLLTVSVLRTTWPAAAQVRADDTAWTEFRRELRRARRNGRPLTLLRVPTPVLPAADARDATTLARQIGAELRLIDRTWVDGDSIYVMLPESSHSAARIVVDRLGSVARTGAVAAAKMATFPEDGLTSGALLAAVHGTAVGQVPIPLRPSLDDQSTRSVEADATSGGAGAR
jgi:hypothetical protein